MPSSTMRRTSSSTATSPIATTASPPACFTNETVSSAARRSMSQTRMRAPSSAKRRDASRPIPIPAPVISTPFFASRPAIASSDPLEVADQLPVRDRLVERLLLQAPVVEVMLDDLVAEGLACHARALQLAQAFTQRLRDLCKCPVLVRVALVHLRGLELLLDPVKAGSDRGRERQ